MPPAQNAVTDTALAAGLAALDLALSWDSSEPPDLLPTAAVPFLAAIAYAPLVWRRRRPFPVLVATVVLSLGVAAVVPRFVPLLSCWLALFAVCTRTSRGPSSVGFGLVVLPILANAAQEFRLSAPEDRTATLVISTAAGILVTAGVFGVGRWVRWSVEQRRLVAELAASEAAADERSRMARDLHDVVAHAVSVMMLQAAGARAMIEVDPARADQALGHVDDLGKEAIDELRQMLRLLGDEHDDPDAGAERLRGVDKLVLTARTAGRPAEFSTTGHPEPLDRRTDDAAYRIVQEAVTNSLKHASPTAPLSVRVDWLEGLVRINVTDGTGDPAPQSTLGTGRGLRGMRERAGAVGGTLSTQALSGGGFAIVAELPTRAKDHHR